MHVKTGDTVRILAGKDKGKEGKILRAIPVRNKVVVDKINIMKKHQKPNQEYPEGGIISLEAPMHVSNVMLICKTCGKPTRTGHRFLDDGKKVRVCKRCDAAID